MDGNGGRGASSLSALCERLRSERLLVASELETLHKLNEQVDAEQAALAQISWIGRQQQVILSRLVNSHPSVRPENCCKLNALLDSAHFSDGYQRIGGQYYSSVTSVLNLLLTSPRSVSEVLHAVVDQLAKDGSSDGSNDDFLNPELVPCVFSLLYGCCVFPTDERYLLEVLSNLVRIQLATHENPRLLLRRGNASFCRLYRLFSEGLFTAKIFLTAALHDPVMFLLSQDELFLDIDATKSAIRFPPEERRRRFGDDENSLSYLQKLTAHRRIIESKLKTITMRFVQGITQAMACFPKSLSWLVRHINTVLIEQRKTKPEEATLICTDLIFTHLICPAITNPETLGVISDTPITYIARFNLMQIGQILQTLALAPFEQPPSHLAYFYSHFDQLSMAQVVKTVLERSDDSLDGLFPTLNSDTQGLDQFVRRLFVGTLSELQCLHTALRSSALDHISDANVRRDLRALMRRLPIRFDSSGGSDKSENDAQKSANSVEPSDSRNSSPSNRGTRLRSLADRVQTAAHKGRLRAQNNPPSTESTGSSREQHDTIIEVLTFPLGDNREPLGLCPEEKFMESNKQTGSFRKHKISDASAEKRTRFVDTESIGLSDRTTDAGSDEEEEAASLSSSIEANDDGEDISTLPDNFSDMLPISANVSGRESPSVSGPPSVSGHETSQSANVGEQSRNASVLAHGGTPEARRAMPNLPVSVRRENTEGLEDKFGKFGLPQQDGRQRYRDETHSLVSDSWSTDVLPSDTEGFISENRHDACGAGGISVQPLAIPVLLPVVAEVGPSRPNLASASRTRLAAAGSLGLSAVALTTEDRSDTWSVDAMASDSEADPTRGDDLLMIDEPDLVERASSTSGNESARLMSGESSGSLAVCASAASQARARAARAGQSEQISTNENLFPGHSSTLKKPADASIFRDLATVSAANQGASAAANANAGRMRRQSSGSSFYSKSDVDSEFSKDLNDDALSSLIGDYTPSFRNSIGEMIAPSSPAASVLATSGSFCNDDGESSANGITQREDSLSPSKANAKNDLDDTHDEPITMKTHSGDDKADPKKGKPDIAEEEMRAKWASSGAMPKLFAKAVDEQATPLAFGKTPAVSAGGRKKMNILHGLQKVGESLKMRKDMAVSTMRQSLSQSASINELASGHGAAGRVRSVAVNAEDVDATPRRLIESRSLNALNTPAQRNTQTADAILDKYKGKSLPPPSNVGERKANIEATKENSQDLPDSDASAAPYYDPTNLTHCRAFLDVKRKLRVVLSSVGSVPGFSNAPVFLDDTMAISSARNSNNSSLRDGEKSDSDHLVDFLLSLLAESINGQNKTLSAQIREVLRCLAAFDKKGVRKLLRTLKDEHRSRTAYLMYLQQSRLTLLQLRSYLQKLSSRLQREKSLTGECLTEVLVRFYLEQRDALLRRFMADFQSLKAQDERMDSVERTLAVLYGRMSQEPMWHYADAERIAYARKSLERSLMAQIYNYALYPNGEADQCRDSVFHKSLQKLSQVVTPDHPELRIPSRLHGECPWPSAQAEITIINAYKSPRDKMACVVRCCETIQNLIILASGRGAPSADDITPVLVYVLIQANPQSLLSNIQYVSSFYGNRMEGEEAYWWAQLTSAVQFIKTLLNKHF